MSWQKWLPMSTHLHGLPPPGLGPPSYGSITLIEAASRFEKEGLGPGEAPPFGLSRQDRFAAWDAR